jgi:glutamyl-tRNA synthetase
MTRTRPRRSRNSRTLSCKTCIYSVGIRPDRVAYIQQLHKICQRMIAEGNAYADDTDPDVQREERLNRLPSKRRDRPSAESLATYLQGDEGWNRLWQEALYKSSDCIRLGERCDERSGDILFPKYKSDEGQEPEVIPHHRTGGPGTSILLVTSPARSSTASKALPMPSAQPSTRTAMPNVNGSSRP